MLLSDNVIQLGTIVAFGDRFNPERGTLTEIGKWVVKKPRTGSTSIYEASSCWQWGWIQRA